MDQKRGFLPHVRILVLLFSILLSPLTTLSSTCGGDACRTFQGVQACKKQLGYASWALLFSDYPDCQKNYAYVCGQNIDRKYGEPFAGCRHGKDSLLACSVATNVPPEKILKNKTCHKYYTRFQRYQNAALKQEQKALRAIEKTNEELVEVSHDFATREEGAHSPSRNRTAHPPLHMQQVTSSTAPAVASPPAPTVIVAPTTYVPQPVYPGAYNPQPMMPMGYGGAALPVYAPVQRTTGQAMVGASQKALNLYAAASAGPVSPKGIGNGLLGIARQFL